MSAVPRARAAPPARPGALRAHRLRAGLIALVALAVALLLAYVGTNVSASLAQRSLERKWEDAVAAARGLTPAEIAARTPAVGDPVGRLRIPALGLDAIVIEGADPGQMRRGPAHLPASPLPGQDGVAIITANRLGFGGFFADLDRLTPGDRILVETLGGRRLFVVHTVDVVPVERLDLTTRATRPVLILFASARRWGGGDRIVVRALEQGF